MGSWFSSSKKNNSNKNASKANKKNSGNNPSSTNQTTALNCKSIDESKLTVNEELKNFVIDYLFVVLESAVKIDDQPNAQKYYPKNNPKRALFKREYLNKNKDPNITKEQIRNNIMNNPDINYQIIVDDLKNFFNLLKNDKDISCNQRFKSDDINNLNTYLEKSEIGNIIKLFKDKYFIKLQPLFNAFRDAFQTFVYTNNENFIKAGLNRNAIDILRKNFINDTLGNKKYIPLKPKTDLFLSNQYQVYKKHLNSSFKKPLLENNVTKFRTNPTTNTAPNNPTTNPATNNQTTQETNPNVKTTGGRRKRL